MYFSLLYLKLFILQNDGITFICILRTICINIILCTGCIIIKMIIHNLLNTLSVSLIDGKILSIKLEFYKHVFQNKNPNKQMLITTLSTKPWNYPDYTMMRTSHIDNHWVRIRIKIPYLLKIPEKFKNSPGSTESSSDPQTMHILCFQSTIKRKQFDPYALCFRTARSSPTAHVRITEPNYKFTVQFHLVAVST